MDVFSEGMRQLSVRHSWLGVFFKMEANSLAAYERTLYKDFDRHTIISRQDRDRLNLPFKDLIAIIPNGVDFRFVNDPVNKVPSNDLVFVGNLGYGPNKSAVLYLVKSILPALAMQQRKVSLLIAGARPGNAVKQLDHHPQVVVRGWMDDIRDAYRDGRIFVAPMFSGLGLQNKILEAMSMGLPCVTTSMVNNAIGAKEGEEILVADTLDGFVSHIISLLENPELHHRISTQGRSFVSSHFKWEDQVEKLDEVIHSKQATLVQ
jgi:glycosyltransferase involved in cell wall biosynthesis